MKKTKTILFVLSLTIILAGCKPSNDLNRESSSSASSEFTTNIVEETVTENIKEPDIINVKDEEYAFMADRGLLYVAKVISDKVIKLEEWQKIYVTDKELKYFKDVGVFKTNDSENNFKWLSDDHTLFTLAVTNEYSENTGDKRECYFVVSVNEGDTYKGSEINEKIANYSYLHDHGYLYRAIPINDKYIKIECWGRLHVDDAEFSHMWDFGVIDTSEKDFEWADNEHSAFMITMQDPMNGYWEKPELTLFCLENKNFKYPSIFDFFSESKQE